VLVAAALLVLFHGGGEDADDVELKLVADDALKRRKVQLAVGVAKGAVLSEGVEVLERQLDREAVQALQPVADLLIVERAAAVGVNLQEELADLAREVARRVEVRE
jgi:hypothetical protein